MDGVAGRFQAAKEPRAVSRKEKWGIAVLIGVLAACALGLVLMRSRPEGTLRGFQNNVIVEQRLINLQKSR